MATKIALVHDWLTGLRGGEKCLQAFLRMYPEADIFTLVHIPGSTTPEIDRRVRAVSFLNLFPGVKRYYRALLPLYPLAAAQFSFRGYDLVISLSHAAAKNIRPPAGVPHVCYCFTPMRYVLDQASTYFGVFTWLLWPIIMLLRFWDRLGSRKVDRFVGISNFIAARIRCFYRRRAAVAYPPVMLPGGQEVAHQAALRTPAAFLYAGALVPYKRVDLVVQACTEMNLPLWVVGEGPEYAKLRNRAGPQVTFFGRVSDQDLAQFYRSCRALVFPVREDFGLVPVECMALGRPVIALYEGASRETVIGLKPWDLPARLEEHSFTGVFIRRAPAGGRLDALKEAMRCFLAHEGIFSTQACQAQAQKFGVEQFVASWQRALADLGVRESGQRRGASGAC